MQYICLGGKVFSVLLNYSGEDKKEVSKIIQVLCNIDKKWVQMKEFHENKLKIPASTLKLVKNIEHGSMYKDI